VSVAIGASTAAAAHGCRRGAASALWFLALAAAGAARAQDEVPFITTPDQVTLAMLQIAEVGPRDHVIDLGSGDGRIVITAAKRAGASGLGVEIVPDLVRRSREHAQAAGVHERVEFRVQDLFATDLGRATVVTMYLLPDVNLQLRPRLLALAPGTRIVSHDWDMGDWQPDRTLTVDVPDKAIGRDKFSKVHLWTVPARVHGLWCSAGATLEVTQRFQRFSATLSNVAQPVPVQVFDGRIEGRALRSAGTDSAVLHAEPGGLRLREMGGVAGTYAGRLVTPAGGPRCS
jgi:SAM-dependent methyltransferase